jgi:hypothetical protein
MKTTLTRRKFAQGSAALILGSTALPTNLLALDSSPEISGELTADLSGPLTPFSRMLFGQFLRMLFGQFLEHFQRQVYGCVFDPGSHLADKDGLRMDVLEALRELKVPIVRWPGAVSPRRITGATEWERIAVRRTA